MNAFLWGVYPYVCITAFLLVPLIRMRYQPFGFSTRASSLFARSSLGVASLCLHWGLVLLFAAHTVGFLGGLLGLGPWVSVFYWGGLLGGVSALFGSAFALWRRHASPEVRAMSQWDDYLVHWFLILILFLGLYQVIVDRIFGVAYTVSAWLASLARFEPEPELMDSASFISKLHVFLALTFFAVFPFTKLVHMWTYPINYMVRPYQSIRTARFSHRRRWEFGLRTDKSFLVYSIVIIAVFFVTTSISLFGRAGGDSDSAGGKNTRLMGRALYVSQCARCHGLDGRGNGPGAASPTFTQPPRDFTVGAYRFVSTDNGVASDTDLARTIRDGLVWAGMPAFNRLNDEQIASLVAVLDGFWENRPEPGTTIEVAPTPASASARRGKELFDQQCALCHGPSGHGDGPAVKALPYPPADLAAGHIKAGRDPEDLYWRISAGIPASGMPAFGTTMSVEDRWSLIEYLQAEIIPPSLAKR